MPTHLRFVEDHNDLYDFQSWLVLGTKRSLASKAVEQALPISLERPLWKQLLSEPESEDAPRLVQTQVLGTPHRYCIGILPNACSRHNTPSRSWAIPALVAGSGIRGDMGLLAVLSDDDHALATAAAIGRSFPSYSGTSRKKERDVHAMLLGPGGTPIPATRCTIVSDAVRRAQDLADRPPNVLGVSALVEEARAVAARCPGASIHVLRGSELADQGLGGLFAVGKAAEDPPALVVLDHGPEGAKRHLCWVGKGIVFDTGGLSIKGKTAMPSMKTDMAGAAAVLAAFEAAVRLGCPDRLTATLAIAENAIGPAALRPDDVITLYSGLTVEVNNTDAEGRLVLADAAAWAVKNRNPAILVDLATLTGAQAMATGKLHAALYCNDEELEAKAVAAGRRSGDLTHPLPYVPELFQKEFISHVADMKNSVKDRNNAQSSCAAQFIGSHLGGFRGGWLHVDMAAPAKGASRSTGYGVGLLLSLFELA